MPPMSEHGPTPQQMRDRPEIASIVYNELKDSERAAFQLAGEYGKWLITTLVVLHGGALLGMFSFLDALAGRRDALAGYAYPVWFFVGGLVLALVAGFFTWLNWSMHSVNFSMRANVAMLWNSESWVGSDYYDKGITITYWTAIVLGFASASCIPIATALVLHGQWFKEVVG